MNRHYRWAAWASVFILLMGGIAAVLAPEPWKTAGALAAGAAASFGASAIIQLAASEDQSRLLRDLGLKVDGFRKLPEEFRRLRWIAHATTAPDSQGKCSWRVRKIDKISDIGDSFVTYNFPSRTLIGEDANYVASFIGLSSAVLAIVSLGDEQTSVIVFDTNIPSAGVYFGPAYITNWFARRDLTLAIVGLGEPPAPPEWSKEIRDAFAEWHTSVKWDAEPLIREFAL